MKLGKLLLNIGVCRIQLDNLLVDAEYFSGPARLFQKGSDLQVLVTRIDAQALLGIKRGHRHIDVQIAGIRVQDFLIDGNSLKKEIIADVVFGNLRKIFIGFGYILLPKV
jgi:hypothetical protein